VDKRVEEIIKMADKGKMKHVERTAQRLNTCLVMAANLAAPQEGEAVVPLAPAPRAVPTPPVAEEPPEKDAGVVMAPAPPAAEEAPVPPGQVKLDRRAKLKIVVARCAVKHPAALHALLERVPESARPELLRIIMELDAEYEKTLKALNEMEDEREDDMENESEDERKDERERKRGND
jgi:hypothetical protein